ncbi:DUF1697 domain-containing protein [Rivibacter subsaxonicus]|uniref:Uncharacterized protein (DUF1697 family) n=1 Tax=Rivibacter subsaxonicus TaxID=457575 RepID=A0A4Q7W1C8_9BURK|nr:DUF1697 domain-containing protein [Rivibacter subsaxonicus]RZU02329.1 uncharacterized protein (DUF1697 family) [Rivibacter subsaxonicus]
MPTYVAFLRAINVGGRFLKMSALAEHFRSLGHADARTYINSGNVVFSSRARKSDALALALTQGLEPLLGFRSEAFVRSRAEVDAIAARALGHASEVPSLKEVNVAFLDAPLDASQLAELLALRTEVDSFSTEGREVYWLCRVGQSESKFSNAVFERRLRLRTTFRRATMLEGLSSMLRGELADPR